MYCWPTTVTDNIQRGTSLNAGNNIAITSGVDTTMVNTDVAAGGEVDVKAGGDVNLLAATDTHEVAQTTSTTDTTSVGRTLGVSADYDNGGASKDGSFSTGTKDGSFSTGTLNTGITATKSETTSTTTTTTDNTHQGTTIRADGGASVTAAGDVGLENTTATGNVLAQTDKVNAGGQVSEATVEDVVGRTETETTTTSTTGTSVIAPDFKQVALDTVGNALAEMGANKIGDLKQDGSMDPVTHKVLHAANGALQGAISSGGDPDGAAAGAIGAAVGETVAELVDDGTATATNEEGKRVTKLGTLAATVVAGLAGVDTGIAAKTADNAIQNNRLLHPVEAKVLARLKENKSEEEQRKLDAVACAEVRCADGVSENDPEYPDLEQRQAYGELLKSANDPAYQALNVQQNNGLFNYTYLATANDLVVSNEQTVSRMLGGIQTGSAAVGTIGSAAITVASAPTCPTTGVGCLVTIGGATLTLVESQRFIEGLKQTLKSDYEYRGGQRVKDSFNPDTHQGDYNPVMNALATAGISVVETGAGKLAVKTARGFIKLENGVSTSVKNTGGGGTNTPKIVDNNTGTGAKPVARVATKETVHIQRGKAGNWNKVANNPKPDTKYEFENGYSFKTDAAGRVDNVSADLKQGAWERNSYQQRVSGGECRGSNDCGGHLIASMFGGPGEKVNLVPMDAKLNGSGGKWYKLENRWKKELKAGKSVKVQIEPQYTGTGKRPDGFSVQYSVNGSLPIRLKLKNTPTGE